MAKKVACKCGSKKEPQEKICKACQHKKRKNNEKRRREEEKTRQSKKGLSSIKRHFEQT